MDYKGALEWAQGLSMLPKGLITAALLAVTVALLVVLWQKPPVHGDAENRPVIDIHPVATSQGQTISPTLSQLGNRNHQNAPTIEQMGAAHPVAQANSGGVNVVGSNPVVAGTYYAAPSTPQEKEQQVDRLKSELSEVASFPDHFKISTPTTILEENSATKEPFALLEVLSRYYKDTIESVPKVGLDLFSFKKMYYDFNISEQKFEDNALNEIGLLAESKIRAAWVIQFKYFMLRSSGISASDIQAYGNFLNFGITWDSAERGYQALSTNPTVSSQMRSQINKFGKLQQQADKLLKDIRAQEF